MMDLDKIWYKSRPTQGALTSDEADARDLDMKVVIIMPFRNN